MEIKAFQLKAAFTQDKKLSEKFEVFKKLADELNQKAIPNEIANSINAHMEEINQFSGTANDTLKLIRKKQSIIVSLLEKELRLVTKNYYRTKWMVVGMSAFGIPIGVAFGLSMGNLGLLGIGLPIGMGIGVAVGASMDKKAKEAGKQLDVELKY